jgi:hypothetical protein
LVTGNVEATLNNTMLRKGAPFVAGVLLLLACSSGSSEKKAQLSPSMEAALRALGDMPLGDVRADLDGGYVYDSGISSSSSSSGSSSSGTSFGSTDTGEDIISGVRSNGPTGNGPGNGGVGFGAGPGNGGVGTGAADQGAARSSGIGNGGVSAGSNDGANELASAICDFLNAFCSSFSRCELGKATDLDCEFAQTECTSFVNDLIVKSNKPITVPPNALSGLRCVSNALRTTCILTASGAQSFQTQIRACGLPIEDQKTETTPTPTRNESTSGGDIDSP